MFNCEECKTTFKKKDSRDKGRFCSLVCFRKYRCNPINSIKWFKCLNCNKERKGFRKTQKYCSSSCQLNYEYKIGKRDRKKTPLKAQESIRINGNPKRKGKPASWVNSQKRKEVCKKISILKTGVPVPRLRKLHKKDKSYWKSVEYQSWRKAVMRRDNFTCVECGDNRGGNLEADHKLPVRLFPELMLKLGNGRTLCKPCHYKTDTWGAKCKKLTRQDFVVPVLDGEI